MASLPLTVQSIEDMGAGLFGVSVALADGTVYRYIVPESMATVEAVTISAVALAQLLDIADRPSSHHAPHRRYAPRT